jgi:hypothetical protein
MAGRRMPVTAWERKEFKRVMGQAERAMSAELAGLPLEHLSINPVDAFQQACLLWRLGAEQIPACMALFVRTFA